MIIELFGPPGAGKTTFARTLAARLRERGHTVDLILSYRPAELSPHEIRSSSNLSAQQISSMIRRLIRPLAEMLTIASHPFTISQDVGTALTLIKILPPSSTLWSLRLAQYVSRLSRAWFQASNTGHIVLFDQAFVQAVGSLVLLCGVVDELLISRALDAIPKADLLVRLDAPTEVLEARLLHRQRLESRIERLLELDLPTSLTSRVSSGVLSAPLPDNIAIGYISAGVSPLPSLSLTGPCRRNTEPCNPGTRRAKTPLQ